MTVDERWAAVGEQLRQLRETAGMSGKGLAELVGWQASKVSRTENARQTITDADVSTWCRACGVPAEVEADLHAELRSIRMEEARFNSRLRRGHRGLQTSFATIEQAAQHISVFEPAVIPGLLQTPDYARAIFTGLSELRGTVKDTDAAVAGRMQRQNILYDTSKSIEILTAETALRTIIGSASIMAGQLDRLHATVGMSNVRFGILPLGVPLPVAPLHGFWLLDGMVNVETLHTEATTHDPVDVETYTTLLRQLWSVAVEGDAARNLLSTVGRDYQTLAGPDPSAAAEK